MKKTFKKIYCTDFIRSDIPFGNALIIYIKNTLVFDCVLVCLCICGQILFRVSNLFKWMICCRLCEYNVMMIVLFFVSSKSYGKADKLKCLTLWMRLNSSICFSSFHLQVNTIIRILLFLLSDFIFFSIIITITPWESVSVCVYVGETDS